MSEIDPIGQLFGARTAVVVDHVIDPVVASALRSELELRGYTRYALVDRGSYDFVDVAVDHPIIGVLAELAARTTSRTVAPVSARAIRLRAGDYVLAHHDRVHEGHPVEVVLDLSPIAVPAELHYRRRGQVYFRVPCAPSTASIVERGPTVTCNHTYVSKLHPTAEVVRLVVLFR